ncbi:tripartite tricarboxylate transporter substrate binding protein [Psychrobacillus lasiicapitis]|uniref:Tripartite tricarboxylate transporter substrate binding protein n=1 Tax=Psychrobacillus lasiicapitis TaxID=1636719 RepID=A0A544SZY0_9BACI|nr:tripartite tricarboxylate transporter substrate-binding protein [Psychrobacillus lasiicapitis]TQR10755.1 tripartite tricarboxylate transporter substrate binding protein [Psychrobacillus lasiicapitis]GGA42737.1 membrane protein [Psychrobacillus lasiicapitis]
MRKKILVLVMTFVTLLTGCSSEKNQEVIGDEVTIIAPSSIGGGWDLTARAMQDVLMSEKLIDGDIQVMNKIGAGGELGWKYTNQQKDHVLAINSSLLITNHLLGQSKITYKDFTPIAILATEWEVVIVSKDSNISSARSLMDNMKEAPHRFKIGVSPRLGNDDQLSFVLVGKQVGLNSDELDFFIYENSAQVVDALLKKQIDVATMTLAEAKKYYDLNQVKMLVISSDKRLEELPDVPTWSEEGIDLVFEHWRGVMGPPNMTKSEIQFWDTTMEKMVQTEKWQQTLEKYMWKDFYKNSSETAKFLEEQDKMYEALMNVNRKD